LATVVHFVVPPNTFPSDEALRAFLDSKGLSFSRARGGVKALGRYWVRKRELQLHRSVQLDTDDGMHVVCHELGHFVDFTLGERDWAAAGKPGSLKAFLPSARLRPFLSLHKKAILNVTPLPDKPIPSVESLAQVCEVKYRHNEADGFMLMSAQAALASSEFPPAHKRTLLRRLKLTHARLQRMRARHLAYRCSALELWAEAVAWRLMRGELMRASAPALFDAVSARLVDARICASRETTDIPELRATWYIRAAHE
jgi:hypothetical protein